MKFLRYALFVFCGCQMLSSCDLLPTNVNGNNPIARVNESYLYASDLSGIVPSGINSVPIVLGDLKLVIFVNQNKKETLNVIEISPIGIPVISTTVSDLVDLNTRKLVRVVDILGKETKPQANIPFIEIYDDRTVEKKIVIE